MPKSFGSPRADAVQPAEVFAPYEDYFDSDTWPAIGKGSEITTEWVGDMAPQHAAASIYKLKRWAYSQFADDLRNERQWAEVCTAPLYRYLAARATGQDFSDIAAGVPVDFLHRLPPAPLTPWQMTRLLLITMAEVLDESSLLQVEHMGELAKAITTALIDKGYTMERIT